MGRKFERCEGCVAAAGGCAWSGGGGGRGNNLTMMPHNSSGAGTKQIGSERAA